MKEYGGIGLWILLCTYYFSSSSTTYTVLVIENVIICLLEI
jgi:hypothetical protein